MSEVLPLPKVARFRPCPSPDDPVYHPVPDDGLCLNTFVVLADRPGSGRVLFGRIDPRAPWERIGGMSRERIATMGDRWVLPGRQLFHFEAPHDAAPAILRDQLGLEGKVDLGAPQVLNEAWQRPTPVGKGLHWDLSFLFRGTWPQDRPLRASPWRELAFHEPASLDPAQVGRSHLDVLALAGYVVRT